MRGIIIAGGKGKRLQPLTKTINKNMLPVYDKPMIYYSIQMLADAGIKEILIVTGTDHSGQFMSLLESGDEFGVKLHYEVQKKPLGPANAIEVAKDFAKGEKVIVVFSDNILEDDIKKHVEEFKKQGEGARAFLKEMPDPKRFGVAEIKENKIVSIEEKPEHPKSNFAILGLYMYDDKVFDIISALKPSVRGEYEVTDVLSEYMKKGLLTYEVLEGNWSDAGTFDSLLEVNNWMAKKSRQKK